MVAAVDFNWPNQYYRPVLLGRLVLLGRRTKTQTIYHDAFVGTAGRWISPLKMYAVERYHASLHTSGLKLLCWITMSYWQLLLAELMCLLMSYPVMHLITERLPIGNTLCGNLGTWVGTTAK